MTDTNKTEAADFDMDKVNALPTFDVSEHLDSPEMIEEFLKEARATNDAELIDFANEMVEKARERNPALRPTK